MMLVLVLVRPLARPCIRAAQVIKDLKKRHTKKMKRQNGTVPQNDFDIIFLVRFAPDSSHACLLPPPPGMVCPT